MSPADIGASGAFMEALGALSREDPAAVEQLWTAVEAVMDELIDATELTEGEARETQGGGYVARGKVVKGPAGLAFRWDSIERQPES